MKTPKSMPSALSIFDTLDSHLILMAGLVVLTGVVAVVSVSLLLLLAPLAALALGGLRSKQSDANARSVERLDPTQPGKIDGDAGRQAQPPLPPRGID
ncbi:hypothetical protein ACIQC5_09280 [Paenarthrobacter sp. NPDC092416]|uniref:hypothetical protein n=1 Tax=Paenarthrobacter sp. NPDC092416 TaxID=3364386 RepID=UPI003814122D